MFVSGLRFLVVLIAVPDLHGFRVTVPVHPHHGGGNGHFHPLLRSTGGTLAIQSTAVLPLTRTRTSGCSSTSLHLWKRLFGREKTNKDKDEVKKTSLDKKTPAAIEATKETEVKVEHVPICVIGGGVSGLVAATTAAKSIGSGKVVLWEAGPTLGGRVQSDVVVHEGGEYVLDRGFAVFLTEYPSSRSVLSYEALDLREFVPGALIAPGFDRVADPLRVPSDLWAAVTADVGSLFDKARVLLVLANVFTNSVADLFAQTETDTATCLDRRYGFGPVFVRKFYRPFLEGIFLSPLSEQSSRMFHFVMKMFSEGYAALPANGGMGRVAEVLVEDAVHAGVDLRTGHALLSWRQLTNDDDNDKDNGNGQGYELLASIKDSDNENGNNDQTVMIHADTVVLATDGATAQSLLSQFPELDSLATLPNQPQRKVGCLYFAIDGPPPANVRDPILVLNGDDDNDDERPRIVNNLCFPSSVAPGYAPEGCSLCSVTVLEPVLRQFEKGDDDDDGNGDAMLERAVRADLVRWFGPTVDDWTCLRVYRIDRAQPGQFDGPVPANVHGGRDPAQYRGVDLPPHLYLCGDHMATATLNGALESGVQAGERAAKDAPRNRPPPPPPTRELPTNTATPEAVVA